MSVIAQTGGTSEFVQIIRDAGAIGVLALGTLAWIRGTIVRGKDLDRAIAAGEAAATVQKERAEKAEHERDRYIELAFRLASSTERAVETVRDLTDQAAGDLRRHEADRREIDSR